MATLPISNGTKSTTSMTREGLVWRKDSGLQIGLDSDSVLPSSLSLKEEYDAIIIGAGFTGLIAARELTQLRPNASILLLDARDRIGGRTWVAKVDGQDLEMGGMWVHWYQPNMWSEITRYGLREKVVTALGTTVPEKAYFKRQGILETIEDEGALERLNELLQMFFSPDGLQMSDIIPRPYDNWFNEELFKKYDAITSEQRIASMDINDKEKDLLRTTVMHLGLCSSEHVGFGEAMHWHSLCGTDMETIEATMGRYKLGHGGTTVLARAIYDDFKGDSMFGAQVDHISQDENGASVELDTGKTFKAKYVICTVPLNVVKDVKFTPSLSSIRQEAVDIGHPGRGGKVHFMVSPALPAFNTSTTSPTELTFLFSDHNVPKTDTSYLVSFVHSDAESKDKLHDAEAMKAAFAQMRPDGAENLTSYAYHDWANDPYARGTWCCFEAGYATKYLKELQSQHGKRVIMASSDWAEGWRGCIDGAIEQGILAAREVKRVLL